MTSIRKAERRFERWMKYISRYPDTTVPPGVFRAYSQWVRATRRRLYGRDG